MWGVEGSALQLTVFTLEREVVIRALLGHESHDSDTGRLHLSWQLSRRFCRDRGHAHRTFLVRRALAELPSKECEKDEKEQEGGWDLQGADEHLEVDVLTVRDEGQT